MCRNALINAFKKVKSVNGTSGVDRQSIKDFNSNLVNNIELLFHELKDKSYRPQPVRRVELDKDDGGKRLLGIPAVRDCVVQQSLKDILEPILIHIFTHQATATA